VHRRVAPSETEDAERRSRVDPREKTFVRSAALERDSAHLEVVLVHRRPKLAAAVVRNAVGAHCDEAPACCALSRADVPRRRLSFQKGVERIPEPDGDKRILDEEMNIVRFSEEVQSSRVAWREDERNERCSSLRFLSAARTRPWFSTTVVLTTVLVRHDLREKQIHSIGGHFDSSQRDLSQKQMKARATI
jgi:hypothetical protein